MTRDEIWHMHMAHITAALIASDKGMRLDVEEIVEMSEEFVFEIMKIEHDSLRKMDSSIAIRTVSANG